MTAKTGLAELRARHGARNDAELRRPSVMLQATALFVGLALIPLIPGGRLVAGVSSQVALIWAATLITGMWGAYLVHRAAGSRSRAYLVADLIESFLFAHGSAALVGLSASTTSIWWLVYFALCVYDASAMGARLRTSVVLGTAPITAATLIYVRTGVIGDAVIALFSGGLGFVAWSVIAKGADRSMIEAAERETLQERVAELERERGRMSAEAERRRIAMDLHDGIGATLTAARLMAQAVRREGGNPQSVEMFDTLDETLREGLSDLRLSVWSLEHDLVGWPELFARLRRHCADACAAAALEFTMTITGERAGTTPPALRLALFRVVQEALNNTLRHAEAKSVSLGLALSDVALAMTYRDDGVGLPREPRSGGCGLANMDRRVRALGGTLEVDSSPACGMSLQARLPMDLPEHA